MKKNFWLNLVAVISMAFLMTGCGQSYKNISQEDAVRIMKSGQEFILLDVRTPEEYEKRHIPGALLLPIDEIKKGNFDSLPDKNKIILVYCWTGRRAEDAAMMLFNNGYNYVYNFGGLVDWTGEVEGSEVDAEVAD